MQSVAFGRAQVGSFPRLRDARGGRGDLVLLDLRASSLFVTMLVCREKLGSGCGLSVVFQPCGTWWLQSSACSSCYFQMLLIYSPFPCSPSRVCAAKLSELAGFLTVRASQMRDALAPRLGEGRARRGAPRAVPAPRLSPALALPAPGLCISFGRFAMV